MRSAPSREAVDVRAAPYAALVLRLALGAVFIAHALAKLLVFTLPGTPCSSPTTASPDGPPTRSSGSS